MRRWDWQVRKAVWGYRLRVLFNRPYRNTVTVEELRQRYLDQEAARSAPRPRSCPRSR